MDRPPHPQPLYLHAPRSDDASGLPSALQAKGRNGAYAPVGGSASPSALETLHGPVSNDPVAIGFMQAIRVNDALRTGVYAKTLTFTLSTTKP